MNEREAFEAWFNSEMPMESLIVDQDNDYKYQPAIASWEAFQAGHRLALASQAQQEAIGEVQHYAAPANLPAYVNVNWHGKPPKNGAKVYFLNPKD